MRGRDDDRTWDWTLSDMVLSFAIGDAATRSTHLTRARVRFVFMRSWQKEADRTLERSAPLREVDRLGMSFGV